MKRNAANLTRNCLIKSSCAQSQPSFWRRRFTAQTETNPLFPIISSLIKAHGPIPVPTYMNLCLTHPQHGYYARRDHAAIFGKKGDFITSPEISQVFGELVAAWFITQYSLQVPSSTKTLKTRLVELGPGRGTLTSDIIRTFNFFAGKVPGLAPLKVQLVESSEELKKEQKITIQKEFKGELFWYDKIEDVPSSEDNEFTFLIAHEFFDALPIHIFQKGSGDNFHELLVDVDQSSPSSFRFVISPGATTASSLYPSLRPSMFTNLSPTQRIEVSPLSWTVAMKIGELIGGDGAKPAKGVGFIADYGDFRSFGDSFRAFRKHEIVSPLREPGLIDLTSNVDFQAISQSFNEQATSHGPLTQAQFLNSLGLPLRLARLANDPRNSARRDDIVSAAQRLVDEAGMGNQYKVMAVLPKGVPTGWPFE
ncbi:DUF185-domain-containing protein [Atractiella rhizophila]|nr:DUF185-domain-containing protein [Atractiella rhizophila]